MKAIHLAINQRINPLFGVLTTGLLTAAIVLPAMAQVTSDGTTNTIVNQSGNNFTIFNGIPKGNNLFHSFSHFSLPTGGSATFNLINTPNITTIFSRVTGGNVSNINGLISTLNSSNPVSLFLMNPAGIVFGANARLDIGGSFLGTTANSIKFADGVEFSATNPGATRLLTISVPIGLQMGSNPTSITVQGGGHNAKVSNPLLRPITSVSGLNIGTRGLQVSSGKTLALVGGNVALNGGLLSAPGGRIELGSSTTGNVGIQAIAQGFGLNYANVNNFGNIQMTQRALASVSGVNGVTAGSVQIQGKQVSISDGSIVLVQNRGSQAAGDIIVNATEILKIIGASPDFQSHSSLINETLAAGASGNIVLSTPQLIIDQGGFVLDRTFSAAAGGNIIANVTRDLTVGGAASGDPQRVPSAMFATVYGSGNGGNISISTQNLSMFEGATVGSRTYGHGNGSNVTIKADAIRVSGSVLVPAIAMPSLIIASTAGNGNGGNLTIDTGTLLVKDSGVVSTSTLSAQGNAGDITIRASESIEVSGQTIPGSPSYIGAAGLVFNHILPTGNGGKITISTPVLNLNNSGRIFVQNLGTGNAGTLNIVADSVKLDNGGNLLATTNAGKGGNINLQIGDLLLMRRGSSISTQAGNNGNGGNITLNSPIIVGLENSDIIANAFQGNGGNINITTQGLFGLKYRAQLTPDSDITASSQFGINGTVNINNFGVDPNSGLVELPANVTDPSQKIATGCTGGQGSSFVATGRGGIPQNPTQPIASDVYDGLRLPTWSDIRDISAYRKTGEVTAKRPTAPETLIQATSWHRNAQGKIELVGDKSSAQVQQSLTCAAVSKS